ncbi:MAG: HD family phosphohydrolase [Ignavibacteriales bacterium]
MMTEMEESKVSKPKNGIFYNKTFHKILTGLLVMLISCFIVVNAAEPRKYELKEGDKSEFVIYASSEVIDDISTQKNRDAAAAAITPKYSREDVLTKDAVSVISLLQKRDSDEDDKKIFLQKYSKELKSRQINILDNQINKIISLKDDELKEFVDALGKITTKIMNQGITEESLERSHIDIKAELSSYKFVSNRLNWTEYKDIAQILLTGLVKPNIIEDKVQTERAKQEARARASNIVKYDKGQIIVAKNDIVTREQIEMLKKLNLIKNGKKIDVVFFLGVLAVLIIIMGLFILFIYNYYRIILESRAELILLSIIYVITLFLAWGFSQFSIYLIPFSFAPILVSIMLNTNLAVFMNILVSLVISMLLKGDINFLYLSLIGGTFAAFAVARAKQRKDFVLAGGVVAAAFALITAFFGIAHRESIQRLLIDSGMSAINGIFSIILATGTLPFWESSFNIITPMKLLELSDPNQPLIKRLLLEAPGTYHHSLLVGNLSEVATEAIGGNALLARVGAYYHDIGKLRRPYFFKENQFTDNPHERMTPSLSTLVITSHTRDGAELAGEYGIPMAIKDIILQHHGTTLVAFFFHKAKKTERLENQTRKESFRYEGPRPTTKEAAVVMLADSIEAAVRSMPDKTEGKIEGLIRKIIKDKLDDGQLDLCDLTLKDLDLIAKSFMKVLNGYFHGRIEYPEANAVELDDEDTIEIIDPLDILISSEGETKEKELENENIHNK